MKIKRFLTLTVVMILAICCLSSCASKAERIVSKADKALLKQPYKISYDFAFTSNDSVLDSIAETLNNTSGYMITDGEKIFTKTETKIETVFGNINYTLDYTFIDDCLYIFDEYSILGEKQTKTIKVFLTEEQKAELLGGSSSSITFDANELIDATYEKIDGKQIIKCDVLSEDFKASLTEMVASAFEGDSKTTVSVPSASVTITLKDNKYVSAVLDCKYEVKIRSTVYDMDMTMTMEYDTDGSYSVNVPDKEFRYNEKDYDSVFGK